MAAMQKRERRGECGKEEAESKKEKWGEGRTDAPSKSCGNAEYNFTPRPLKKGFLARGCGYMLLVGLSSAVYIHTATKHYTAPILRVTFPELFRRAVAAALTSAVCEFTAAGVDLQIYERTGNARNARKFKLRLSIHHALRQSSSGSLLSLLLLYSARAIRFSRYLFTNSSNFQPSKAWRCFLLII